MQGILLGGPAYNHLVHTRHCVTISDLSARMGAAGWPLLGNLYRHATPIARARNMLFHTALQTPADILVWMDSDCGAAGPEAIEAMMDDIAFVSGEKVSVLGWRCRQRDGGWNVWDPSLKRITELDAITSRLGGRARRARVGAVGMAGAVFNLDWYRTWANAWLPQPWFRDDWVPPSGLIVSPDLDSERPYEQMSEDVWHCARVNLLGGFTILGGAELVHLAPTVER